MIAAGDLRHVITIQNRVMIPDEYGGEVPSWVDYLVGVRAKYAPIKGRELVAGMATQSELTARFYVRYISGLDSSMRIVFNGQYFDIAAPPIDIDGGGRELEILVKTGTSEG